MLIKKIFKILTKKDKIRFIFAVFFLIIKSVLEIIGIGMIVPILNFSTNQKNSFIFENFPSLEKFSNDKLILFFVLIFILTYLLKTIFIILNNAWSLKFINNLSVNIAKRILEKYLNKNYIFFLENNPSFFVRNITSESNLLAQGLIGNMILSLTQIIFIISVCTFLMIYNLYSILVIIILILICGIIIWFTNNSFKKWGNIRQEKSALILKRINEIVGSIKEVILYDKKNFFADEFNFHNKKLAKANIYRDVSLAFTGPIIEFIGILIFFSFFLFLVIYSNYELGEITVLFGVFAFASIKLLPAVISLSRSIQSIKFNLPACDVVYQILKEENFNYTNQQAPKKKKITINQIKYDNICFFYKNQKKRTLDNLNFEINKGDKIAIIGETGSGKTTLLNIITTLVDPSSGKITINNSNHIELLNEFRNSIGYVPQSVYLSDDSILKNIALSKDITHEEEEKILQILDPLNLSYINNKLIDIHRPIGERGSSLSGGQIQRIGIARALFRDPNILILDEATSALDNETETKILDYLFKEFKNKIIILCTHKKELLKYCNKILEVKESKIMINKN